MLCFVVLLLSFYQVATFQHMRSTRLGTASSLTMHFEEAIAGNTLLKEESLKADRYLATNRFRVRDNAMPKFEKRWADRTSRLALLPGFRFFSLFRRVPAFGVTYGDDEGFGNYISFTYWQNKENFDSWRTGEAFKEAHGGGGITDFIKLLGTALFILKGSPKPAFYDALLLQEGERLSFATDNGWRSISADGVNFIDSDVFMAQNRFKIFPGREVEFEQYWANRESNLQSTPGFVAFSLLRRDADKADDGFNYISSTIWRSKEAFEVWTKSDAFKASHAKAGSIGETYAEKPKLAFYEGKLTLCNENGI